MGPGPERERLEDAVMGGWGSGTDILPDQQSPNQIHCMIDLRSRQKQRRINVAEQYLVAAVTPKRGGRMVGKQAWEQEKEPIEKLRDKDRSVKINSWVKGHRSRIGGGSRWAERKRGSRVSIDAGERLLKSGHDHQEGGGRSRNG